ncbi:MAG: VOC family protein [Ilumatobacteraceae bacterium]|nr:VOC family protein [Acidimicrobiales bacterium]MCB9395919.1 VOC family protein [Acidimicrobiaceae bacterium]
MSFSPYLFFSGNCAEAFRRYHEVLGGQLDVMTHEALPPGADPMPGAEPHHVMHACITLDGGMLMGSDDPSGDDGPKTGIGVTFTAPDVDTARRVFEQLSDGGTVTMAFEPTFWSSGFGSCVDRFGVSWMIDTAGTPAT